MKVGSYGENLSIGLGLIRTEKKDGDSTTPGLDTPDGDHTDPSLEVSDGDHGNA